MEQSIHANLASKVMDVAGKPVTPGFIDLHGHFYHGGYLSAVPADQKCLASGVTTGIDAGSAGIANSEAMKDYVFPSYRTRLLAFINLSAPGMSLSRVQIGEMQDMRLIDVDGTADAIRSNPGFLVGVKVRMKLTSVAYWNALKAVQSARAVADKARSRIMVHVSDTPIPLPQVLECWAREILSPTPFTAMRSPFWTNAVRCVRK